MGALPHKKSSVVRIESARRRRRLPAGPDKPHPPSSSAVALAVFLIIAAATTTFGLWVVFEFVQQGKYVAAAMVPLWVILPGCAPLAVLIIRRRRAARAARAKVTRFSGNHRPGSPLPGRRS